MLVFNSQREFDMKIKLAAVGVAVAVLSTSAVFADDMQQNGQAGFQPDQSLASQAATTEVTPGQMMASAQQDATDPMQTNPSSGPMAQSPDASGNAATPNGTANAKAGISANTHANMPNANMGTQTQQQGSY